MWRYAGDQFAALHETPAPWANGRRGLYRQPCRAWARAKASRDRAGQSVVGLPGGRGGAGEAGHWRCRGCGAHVAADRRTCHQRDHLGQDKMTEYKDNLSTLLLSLMSHRELLRRLAGREFSM